MIARDITRDCELLLALAAALLALSCTTIARADPCPAEVAVRERVARQLDDPNAWSAMEIAIAVEESERGYRLTLDTEHEGMHGSRVFEGASCDEVVSACALLLALTLDQARSQASPAPPPPPPAPMSAPPVLPPVPPRRAQTTVKAALLGELGYLPRIGVGAELAVGLAVRRTRIELTALWLPSVRSESSADGSRVAIGLWAARLGTCQRLVGRGMALFGCLGLELGRARGEGQNLAIERERAYLWSAGHAGLRASLSLTRGIALLVEPALAVPFTRRRFVSLDAAGTPSRALHTTAPVSGRLAIALEAVF